MVSLRGCLLVMDILYRCTLIVDIAVELEGFHGKF